MDPLTNNNDEETRGRNQAKMSNRANGNLPMYVCTYLLFTLPLYYSYPLLSFIHRITPQQHQSMPARAHKLYLMYSDRYCRTKEITTRNPLKPYRECLGAILPPPLHG